ncbi:hypothetical protein Tco_0104324 [Tanacetum coccineum]
MITIRSKMEDRKSSRLMETVDIMDLIPFVGNVLYITQDRAPSGVRIATKSGGSLRRQETIRDTLAQTRSERVLEQPNEPPLSEGHTSRSVEGRME